MEREAIIERRDRGDQGTFGKLFVPDSDQSWFTGELPWRNNSKNISCVPTAEWCIENKYCLPEGDYKVVMRKSPKFGWTYWMTDIPLRSLCLIHSANLMGDVSKGFKAQLNGCIALGFSLGWLEGQKAVLRSRPAVLNFMSMMNKEPFTLKIVDM